MTPDQNNSAFVTGMRLRLMGQPLPADVPDMRSITDAQRAGWMFADRVEQMWSASGLGCNLHVAEVRYPSMPPGYRVPTPDDVAEVSNATDMPGSLDVPGWQTTMPGTHWPWWLCQDGVVRTPGVVHSWWVEAERTGQPHSCRPVWKVRESPATKDHPDAFLCRLWDHACVMPIGDNGPDAVLVERLLGEIRRRGQGWLREKIEPNAKGAS